MFEILKRKRYRLLRVQPPDPEVSVDGQLGRRRRAGRAGRSGTGTAARPKGRPGRKPKGSVPAVVTEMPDRPDPDHVLTWRQRKVLQVIRDSVQRRGYPPSMREIGEAVGLTSTSSVSYQLSTLQSKGYLRRTRGARGPSRSGCPGTRPYGPTLSRTKRLRWTSPRRKLPTCRWSAGSPLVVRSSPRKLSRTSSRCLSRSSATAHSSCSRWSATP